ncbi:MAG: PAS domain S-box protein [Chitinophagaceae bacterium]|nr:PAS domain S-box protein [Chitinophagaceae bacterium]
MSSPPDLSNLLFTDINYFKIFECLEEALAIEETGGLIVQVNNSMCELTGYTRKEWLQQEVMGKLVPEAWQMDYRAFKECCVPDKKASAELFLKRKDESGFWAEVRSIPLQYEHGLPSGRLISLRDIAGRKQQLEELKRSDERLSFLLEVTSEGILIHEKGVITDVNDAALKMFGYSREQVIGKTVFDFAPPKEHHRIIDNIENNQLAPIVLEVYNLKRQLQFIELQGKTIEYLGKRIRIILLKDISEMREKRIEEERLVSIIEASPFIVAMIDRKGLRYMNRAGRYLLGYGADEDLSRLGLKNLLTKSTEELIFKKGLPAAVKDGSWKGRTKFKTKDGREIPVSQTILVHVDENNEVDFYSTIAEDNAEREHAEKSLLLSRERLRYFMEESREAIIIHENGKVIDFNNAAQRMFGFEGDELKGKEMLKLYDIALNKDLKRKVMLQESFQEELTGVRKDGKKFDIEVYSRSHIYQGKKVRVVGIMDITARKDAERALRSSEVRLKAAIAGTQVGIWDWNLITNKVTYNESWRKLFGYSTDSAPQYFDEWQQTVHPSDLQGLLIKLRRHLYGETPMFQDVYRAKHNDEKYIVIESKGKLVRDEYNMPVSIVGTAVDITERQAMEDAVRKSQAQLIALIENREESIWSVDENKKILNFNKPIAFAFKEYYGITMKQGMLITDGFPEPIASMWLARYERSLKGESFSIVDQYDIQDKIYFVEYSLNPIRVEDGNIIGVSVLGRNITQQKIFEKSLREAKEAAEAANQTKSQFLANMSHEIRTPMNGIMGFADLLLQSKLTSEQHEYLHIVRYSADSLLMLINDLLDISKIESGKLELVNAEFNFTGLMKDLVRSFKIKAKEQHLKIILKTDPLIPIVVIGDEMRFRQVMVNLISNAVKFSNDGIINIKSKVVKREEKKWVILTEVIDKGIGIKKEKQQMIFEPFNQIDSLHTRKYGGTGLGLSIARNLVNMMGGEIEVESEPGKGSRFYFTVDVFLPPAKL